MMRQRPDWHLRAEEYRAMAETMTNPLARDTLLRLAEQCEFLGSGVVGQAKAGRDEFLERARECRAFAEIVRSRRARDALELIARRWVALADDAA